MYIPQPFDMGDTETAHNFMEQYDFGILVSDSFEATHLPLLLKKEEGQLGTLYGHVARPNPHWQQLDLHEVLVIFAGPHGYISPSWYKSVPAVPTWNYSAVHVTGSARLINDVETKALIQDSVRKYEPALLAPNNVLTEDHLSKLLAGIVGFKIEIKKLQGKVKHSQNRDTKDRDSVVSHLKGTGLASDAALAESMERYY